NFMLDKNEAAAYKVNMKKKILVIDESPLLRDFLKKKLEEIGCEVVASSNGLEGSLKVRSFLPDLVILDYYLSRKSSLEVLKEMKENPNTAHTPAIMASSKIDRETLMEVAKFNVKKFLTKPIKMDALLKSISEILGVNVSLDSTPCIIEAHVNEDILFIEIAQGLNTEKIELLKYKITELIDLYEIQVPKVLVIMSNLSVTGNDSLKLNMLLTIILEYSQARSRFVKILTTSDFVASFVKGKKEFEEIEVCSNLEQAMDGLLGRKAGSFIDQENLVVHSELLAAGAPKKSKAETIHLRFEGEKAAPPDLAKLQVTLAVVDDDFVIQELIKTAFSDTNFKIETFDNGSEFLNRGDLATYDLVFLDLMMPVMDGFQTLEELQKRGFTTPIIVLSALSQRETVIKALKFGVKSYLIKPLKPEWIWKKATEILSLNF
ncbi:MAG: response regulator, partial [Spirochaetales bacterium]